MDNKKLLNDDELNNVVGGFDTSYVYVDPETGLPFTGWRNDIPGWEGKWFYFDNGVIVPNAQIPYVVPSDGWPAPSSDGGDQGGPYWVSPDWKA